MGRGNYSIVLGDLEYSEGRHNNSYGRHIEVEKVKSAIRRMRRERVTRPNEIRSEL